MTTLLDLIPTGTNGHQPPARWLIDHLRATGSLTETGVSRRAQIRACRRCHSRILTGLDQEDWGAFEAVVDPAPLNQLGELAALMAGRHTWALHMHGGRYVLDDRTAEHITARPAGTATREDVLPQHTCTPIPTELTTSSTFSRNRHHLPPGSPPPF